MAIEISGGLKVLFYDRDDGVSTIECFECKDKPMKTRDTTHPVGCLCKKCCYIQCQKCLDTRVLFAICCYACKGEKRIDYGHSDDGHGQVGPDWRDCSTCEGNGFLLVPEGYHTRLKGV